MRIANDTTAIFMQKGPGNGGHGLALRHWRMTLERRPQSASDRVRRER